MPIITLTTDLGFRDFYLSAVKGTILSRMPGVMIIDISHQIASFNIAQAAFALKNSYNSFPEGTVHVIGVDNSIQKSVKHVAMSCNGHFFIGADNGIFSLLFDKHPDLVVELDLKQDSDFMHFPLKDLYVKAACHLASGGTLEMIGKEISELQTRALPQPIIESNAIKGHVIYIDSFQNVITNINKALFQKVSAGRSFSLYFRRNEYINTLSSHYYSVPDGEKLCLFGISDHLEIAINKGKAASLLGLDINDIIRIEFK